MSFLNQRRRLDEYDRWLSRPGLEAAFMRWLMGTQGAFLINGPLLRLPDQLELDPGLRVLDIGCGRASVLRFLDTRVQFRHAPIGLDFSRTLLSLAQRDNKPGRPQPMLIQGSATQLPFAEQTFDIVLCGYVVKHLDDPALLGLLDEIWRVLTSGGLALVWEFSPTGNTFLDTWNSYWIGRHVSAPQLRSNRSLLEFVQNSGFPFAIEAGLRPFLFPPIPRASILFGKPPTEH